MNDQSSISKHKTRNIKQELQNKERNQTVNIMKNANQQNRLLAAAASVALAFGASNAHAWLGGFEPADGYQPFLNMVQNYNAGHYGPNSGYGGAAAAITPNTDFWKALQGGTFSGGGVSYATGHQNLDRTYINTGAGSANDQSLQLTTNHVGWSGPALEYTYNIDAPDLGGVAPSSTGNDTVNMSLWYRAALNGTDNYGFVPEGYFGDAIEVRDSASNTGVKIGITQRATGDKLTYWNGSSLFESTIPAPEYKFDRIDLTVNVANDTFSLDYFQFNTSTMFNLVVNQPLMSAMNDFSVLDFRTSPGINNEKHFGMNIDDVHMRVVPEPASMSLLAASSLALFRRRR